jgi:hypothetical protein
VKTALIVSFGAAFLSAASLAPAQTNASSAPGATTATTSDTSPNVRHVIGLANARKNASGKLTVQDGVLEFKTPKVDDKVQVSSIEDVFIGTEVTQAGGKKGRAVKVAAIAAPYETGRALPILMRTKVDILTVSFHDAGGALHGAIFALPIGQAEPVRAQLIQAGVHASPIEQ